MLQPLCTLQVNLPPSLISSLFGRSAATLGLSESAIPGQLGRDHFPGGHIFLQIGLGLPAALGVFSVIPHLYMSPELLTGVVCFGLDCFHRFNPQFYVLSLICICAFPMYDMCSLPLFSSRFLFPNYSLPSHSHLAHSSLPPQRAPHSCLSFAALPTFRYQRTILFHCSATVPSIRFFHPRPQAPHIGIQLRQHSSSPACQQLGMGMEAKEVKVNVVL